MGQLRGEDRGRGRWTALEGELGREEARHLRGTLDEAARRANGDVVLDLAGVAFIGTFGVGPIARRERLGDRGLALGPCAFVEKTFQGMSLAEVFERA